MESCSSKHQHAFTFYSISCQRGWNTSHLDTSFFLPQELLSFGATEITPRITFPQLQTFPGKSPFCTNTSRNCYDQHFICLGEAIMVISVVCISYLSQRSWKSLQTRLIVYGAVTQRPVPLWDWLVSSKWSPPRDFLSRSLSHLTDPEIDGGLQMEKGLRGKCVSTLTISVLDFPHAMFFLFFFFRSELAALAHWIPAWAARSAEDKWAEDKWISTRTLLRLPGANAAKHLPVCAVVVLNQFINCFYRLGTYVKL